jgi:hypothetical protein
MAENMDEVVAGVKKYLDHPELHRDGREWIVKYVCERVDGSSGKRMAEAIADMMGKKTCKP